MRNEDGRYIEELERSVAALAEMLHIEAAIGAANMYRPFIEIIQAAKLAHQEQRCGPSGCRAARAVLNKRPKPPTDANDFVASFAGPELVGREKALALARHFIDEGIPPRRAADLAIESWSYPSEYLQNYARELGWKWIGDQWERYQPSSKTPRLSLSLLRRLFSWPRLRA